MTAWLKEIKEKYGLEDETVQSEIERIMAGVLSRTSGHEVTVFLEGDSAVISGYTEHRGEVLVKRFDPHKTGRGLIRAMKYEIERGLYKRSVYEDYLWCRSMVGQVVYGTIMKVISDGPLYVEVRNMEGRENIVAKVEKAHQTPRERQGLRAGMSLPFHVLDADAVYDGGVPRLEIGLSRNSRGLPEGLLRQELYKICSEIKVRCERRVAGAFSEIRASDRVPNECIKIVSDILGERIVVKWKKESADA